MAAEVKLAAKVNPKLIHFDLKRRLQKKYFKHGYEYAVIFL